VEVAKALGGSFKLVTLTPKNCNEDDNCPGKHKRMWTHKQIKETQMNIQNTNLG